MTVTKQVQKKVAPVRRKTEYDPKDRRERMQGYMRSQQEIWFDFSVDASLCYHEEQWREWVNPETNEAYTDFGECAMSEWGISYKVGMMRVAMGDAIREHGLTKEMVGTEMGWAKFHAISSAFHEDMKKSEVKSLLGKAQKLSLSQLKEFVKEVKTERVGGEIHKRTTLKYTLLNEMAEVVQNSINIAKEIIGITQENDELADGMALEYIMSEWGMNHNPKLRAKIMETLHVQPEEAEEEEAKPKAPRKKSAATKKKEKTVAKKEKAAKAKEDEDEEEEEFEEEEEAPAPKAKAKTKTSTKKAAEEEEEEEFEDEEDEDVDFDDED